MFFDGWRLLFYITNLVYFIRNNVTQMEKLEEFKNTIFRHPDAWIGLMWASSVFGGTHYQVTAMSILGFSSLYTKRRVFMHPTAGKLACYSTAGAL